MADVPVLVVVSDEVVTKKALTLQLRVKAVAAKVKAAVTIVPSLKVEREKRKMVKTVMAKAITKEPDLVDRSDTSNAFSVENRADKLEVTPKEASQVPMVKLAAMI